jgi:hypothetical protein
MIPERHRALGFGDCTTLFVVKQPYDSGTQKSRDAIAPAS